MKTFLVNIGIEDPYIKFFEYREKAGKIEVAIHRALMKFRKEHWRGRPLKRISVKAELL